ncbi:Uma2 family endonuclease, partial [Moorena sp. SIO3I6]|uniref:Uma2 family endonuclease n=1 Tax=Moorena sp. SIO3I6 TaxID=2607831 RepID=UPI0013F7FA74
CGNISGSFCRILKVRCTPPHATGIRIIYRVLDNRLRQQGLVQTQLPVQLSNYSEPQPDLAVVMPDELRYLGHHPTPSEIYLIIEVADTNLRRYCEQKAKHYAEAEIADYWVVDLTNRQLHVFREPTEQGYQSQVILADDNTISPLQFPDCLLSVSQMLPPEIPEFVDG